MFTFTAEDGTVIELPLKFKTKILRQASKLPELEFMFCILDNVADETNIDRIDELDVAEMRKMFTDWQLAWQAKAEASMGESSRSSS